MKTIILTRHGKSSWKFPDLKDIDRPLKKKGAEDAVIMAKMLKESGLSTDCIVTSPAVRARSTAEAIANELGIDKSAIVVNPRLYLESRGKMLKEINALEDKFSTVVMVAHNPGITDLASLLAEKFTDQLPTTGMAAIQFNCSSWKEIEKKKSDLGRDRTLVLPDHFSIYNKSN